MFYTGVGGLGGTGGFGGAGRLAGTAGLGGTGGYSAAAKAEKYGNYTILESNLRAFYVLHVGGSRLLAAVPCDV